MIKVPVVTSDNKIWNHEDVILNLAKFQSIDEIALDLLTEGPCLQDVGLEALLDKICDRLQIDPNRITIYTSNQIKSSHYKECRTGFAELDYSIRKANSKVFHACRPTKRFGMFIGRSNWRRLGLAAHLWKYHRSLTCMTFHFDFKNDFHKDNFGLERLLREDTDHDSITDFIKHLPIKFDYQQYPILWNDTAFDLESKYDEIFCDVVCETFTHGKTFFMTEKTLRPIVNRKPFVVQGSQWYLKNLRLLGFKTFNDWWPEDYDDDIDGGSLRSIKDCLDYIAGQDQSTIDRWQQEMMSVVQHNFNNLCCLTNQRVLTTGFRSPS